MFRGQDGRLSRYPESKATPISKRQPKSSGGRPKRGRLKCELRVKVHDLDVEQVNRMSSFVIWNARIDQLPDHLAVIDRADRAIANRLLNEILPRFLIQKRKQR
jgi:hypothetical protein